MAILVVGHTLDTGLGLLKAYFKFVITWIRKVFMQIGCEIY